MTQRKEKSKRQAAGHVDTKSQRIPVRWHGTLFLQASPHVPGFKRATLASVTHWRLQKSHLTANSFSTALQQPWVLHEW